MKVVGTAIGVCACRPTADTIQVVITVGLCVGSERGAAGSSHTMVAAAWRATVACPGQAIEGVVTEPLVLRRGHAALHGNRGAQAQYIAHTVIGAGLAPEGLARFRHAITQRALDTIVPG